MAEKKTAQEPQEEELFPVFFPEDDEPDNFVIVTYNGRRIQIMKGVEVKVPRGFYEVIQNARAEMVNQRKFQRERSTK